MTTSLSLNDTALRVDPGQSVSTQLRVRNTGSVVDQFSFQPLGDAAAWLSVDPPLLRLFPDTDQFVTVTLAPPREPTTRPGPATWAVKAIPQEDPDGAAVSEGTVDVGEFVEVTAELQPVNGRARFTGRFDVAVDNRGNVAVPVRLLGTDAEQALAFDLRPAAIETTPGSAHFAKVAVKPPKKIWRGTPITHPFQIVVDPQQRAAGVTTELLADEPAASNGALPPAPVVPPIVLAGNLVQEAIIPKWLWKAVVALIVALLALWIIWKTLLKPEVESAARAVAVEEVEEVAEDVATLSTEVEQASEQAAEAQETAEEAAAGGAPATTAPPDGGGAPATTEPGDGGASDGGGPVIGPDSEPVNFRLVADVAAGSTGSAASAANPGDTTIAITDFVYQNPGGDLGTMTLSIDGSVVDEVALESFRSLDFHYVAPFIIPPGGTAEISVACATDQIVTADPCHVAVTFGGYATVESSEG